MNDPLGPGRGLSAAQAAQRDRDDSAQAERELGVALARTAREQYDPAIIGDGQIADWVCACHTPPVDELPAAARALLLDAWHAQAHDR